VGIRADWRKRLQEQIFVRYESIHRQESDKWNNMVQQLNRCKANKLTWQWLYEFLTHIAQLICLETRIPYTCVAWLVVSLCVRRRWGKVYMLLLSGSWSSKSVKRVNTAHLLQEQRSFNSNFTSRSLLLMCWVLFNSCNLVRKVVCVQLNA